VVVGTGSILVPVPIWPAMSTTLIPPNSRHTGRRRDRYHRRVPETQVGSEPESLGIAFARGEADLRAVYDRHGALVYAMCRKALGEAAAGDVTQDVFVSAWTARHQFDPQRGPLGAWLVGIAKRRIVDHVRREQRHTSRRADDESARGIESLPADERLDERVDRIAERMEVARALAELPERSREVIGLAYVHGLTHHEIAERTGIPLGTIKSDIRRGLLTLRDRMEHSHE
jgi:RNA polymerase sigma-70 factor (ECF subfamily)